ncbi:olfactory receptor 4E2-like [Pleurodeles waltl]|uniref:olfactory receptor 4E2-like n=1 Tax=Pleurodeles waltl TaxID=8319 RepID=UPI003709B77B
MVNETTVEDFLLLGFSKNKNLQILLFFVFLIFYILTLLGNLLIIVTVKGDSSLHSPMYYFLGNLSFVDLCYPSVSAPKMLVNFLSETKNITYNECMSQIFFFHFFGCVEIFILTVMSFDRYVAICNPLRYTTIMDRRICSLLVFACWVGGAVHSTAQVLSMMTLPFCGPKEVDHFFCDIPPLLTLACTDTFVIGALIISNSGLISLVCFLILIISYTLILHTVRGRSSEGKRKALSTCGAHLTVVTIFFGPCVFIYLRPATTFSLDKIVSVFYAVITPMLNPIIYTLRNAEVKLAMKKLVSRRICLSSYSTMRKLCMSSK